MTHKKCGREGKEKFFLPGVMMYPGASDIVADLRFFFTYFFVGDILLLFLFFSLIVWVRRLDGPFSYLSSSY
jgi:hypothetical protein